VIQNGVIVDRPKEYMRSNFAVDVERVIDEGRLPNTRLPSFSMEYLSKHEASGKPSQLLELETWGG
jgi:hypothetical protein